MSGPKRLGQRQGSAAIHVPVVFLACLAVLGLSETASCQEAVGRILVDAVVTGNDLVSSVGKPAYMAVLVFVALVIATVVALAYGVRSSKSGYLAGAGGLRSLAAKVCATLADTSELNATAVRLLSLFLLLIAGLMSFVEYSRPGFFCPYTLSFRPKLLSAIVGLLLVAPLYLRKILKWNLSVYSILSFILILVVFSSFVELARGGNEKGETITLLLGAAVLLSWLGIRAVAGVGWLLPLGTAVYSAVENEATMGTYGFIYILSGFLGLLLHTGLNPGQLIQGFREEFSPAVEQALRSPKQDIAGLGDAVTEMVKTVGVSNGL